MWSRPVPPPNEVRVDVSDKGPSSKSELIRQGVSSYDTFAPASPQAEARRVATSAAEKKTHLLLFQSHHTPCHPAAHHGNFQGGQAPYHDRPRSQAPRRRYPGACGRNATNNVMIQMTSHALQCLNAMYGSRETLDDLSGVAKEPVSNFWPTGGKRDMIYPEIVPPKARGSRVGTGSGSPRVGC